MRNLIYITLFGILIIFSPTITSAQTGNYFGTNTTGDNGSEGAGDNRTTGDYNIGIGDSSLFNLTSGLYNTALGFRSGFSLTTARENTFLGYEAAYTNTTGTDNVFIGFRTGFYNNATDNTFVGNGSGFNNTIGGDNTFIGHAAGADVTSGYDNTFVGNHAGCGGNYSITDIETATTTPTTASDNTAIGSAAGYNLTTGYRNAFLGSEAGYDNTTGYRNTYIGDSAGVDCSIGHHNTFLGQASGSCTEYSSYNTFVGSYAGWDNNRTNNNNNLDGMNNTYLGYRAGYTNREGRENVVIGSNADFGGVGYTTNNYNVIIGTYARLYANNLSNNVILGHGARINKNDAIAIGYNTYVYGTRSIGIGTQVDIDNQNAIGMGYQTQIQGDYSIAIGYQDTITSDSSIAIGFNNSLSGSNTFAFGNNIKTSAANSILLGGTTEHMTVGIGTIIPNQNASIDLAENDKGFLINRMLTTQRITFGSLLTASEEGMMIFDTEENKLFTWNGTQWLSSGIQDLDLTTNLLSISDGNSVDLSVYLDNTDVQDLTNASLSGTILQIDIENGNSVSVDLYTLIADLEARIVELENSISDKSTETGDARLYQNIPNPSYGSTIIQYYVPTKYFEAILIIHDTAGKKLKEYMLDERGKKAGIQINQGEFRPGSYFYTLYVDGLKIDTRAMVFI